MIWINARLRNPPQTEIPLEGSRRRCDPAAIAGGVASTANYLAWAVMTDVQSLEALAQQPLDAIDLNLARSIVRQTRQDTDALRTVTTPMFWAAPAFGWLPHYGSDIVAASDLIDFSFELSTATGETLTAFEPLLNEPGWRWLVCCPSFWEPRRPVHICC